MKRIKTEKTNTNNFVRSSSVKSVALTPFYENVTRIIYSAFFLLVALVTNGGTATDFNPEGWLRETEAAYSSIASYTAVFHKQQRVSGKLLPEETILLKCRRKPFSLYMKWIKKPNYGSELLYVKGWNQDRIRAHKGGILRFFKRNLDPRDPVLMKNNLHPVTSIGIDFLIEAISINMRKAIKAGELTFVERGQQTVYGRKTRTIEIIFPKEKAQDYAGWRIVINQDVESKILLRIRIYRRENRIIENYGYENLKLNAPLTDADFDPENPEYHF